MAVKFNSTSTPGHKMDLAAWLVELAMTRFNQGIRLPQRFWTDTRYKFKFGREIQAVRKFMKEFGEKRLLEISLREYITTYTDYAQMNVYLQKMREQTERLAAPKDTSEVKPEVIKNEGPDLRESRVVKKKKLGLFQRIQEIQDVSTKSTQVSN